MSTAGTGHSFAGVHPIKLAPDAEPAATKPDFVRDHAPERARALRFLATRTAALTGAYAISVSILGDITLQGQDGALQDLVTMWGAPQTEPADAWVPDGYREWKVTTGDPAVKIRIVEEGDRDVAPVTA